METLKFKTNINCGGCVAKVAPFLNRDKEVIKSWKVDTTSPDRILTVETTRESDNVISVVEEAGFKAQLLNEKPD